MPSFTFDLESFTSVTLDAPNEKAARAALEAVLQGLAGTDYLIDRVTCAPPPVRDPDRGLGRPASARALKSVMKRMLGEGMTREAIAAELGVNRVTVWRVLKG